MNECQVSECGLHVRRNSCCKERTGVMWMAMERSSMRMRTGGLNVDGGGGGGAREGANCKG